MNKLQTLYRQISKKAPHTARNTPLEDYIADTIQAMAEDNIMVMLSNIDLVSTYPGMEEAMVLHYPIPSWVQESSLNDDNCLAWWLFESPAIASCLFD